jgi:two-component system, NtrC family, C4-dicarboxylate transport sensor histidine kinase DctB
MQIHSLIKKTFLWLCGCCAVVAMVVQAHRWALLQGYERMDDSAAGALDLYASTIENELGKHAYLACLLATDTDMTQLLVSPEQMVLRNKVATKLARTSVASGILGAWLVNPQTQLIAASDNYRSDSHYAILLSRHSAIEQALKGQDARGFVLHPITAAPEYFFACPVRQASSVVGAVVVAVSLAPMEATWVGLALRHESDKPVVADASHTIILSSVPDWKFQSIHALLGPDSMTGPSQQATLALKTSIYWRVSQAHFNAAAVRAMVRTTVESVDYAAVIYQRDMPRFGWRLLVYSNATEVDSNAQLAAWGMGSLGVAALMLGLVWQQRRRVVAQKLATRQALQQAYDQLEIIVRERTQELQNSNRELQHEITVRHQAEAVLREAQSELIQAGKMAVLGQMSASISHEVGQPLTAMRALAGNARLLLARGQSQAALDNLSSITELVDRMGRITAQLKSFARKSNTPDGQVHLSDAVRNVCALLDSRMREEKVQLILDVRDTLYARCDGNRLEQVLINLMVNAMDAMQTQQIKKLSVRAWPDAEHVRVRISDTGGGIPATSREHLFEPFFTTKSSGLGLGLVISANIVKEFGGSLQVLDSPQGAAFEFAMTLLKPPHE